MNITVYCGARVGEMPAYRQAAEDLGSWIAKEDHTLVYGGGRIGLMGALADSVIDGGGKAIGVIPEFLSTKEKRHQFVTKMYTVKTMAERKNKMVEMGDVFVALPGGTGTLEEIIEAISLNHLKRHDKPCVLVNIMGFYDPLVLMLDVMVEEDFLSQEARDGIYVIDSIEELEDIAGDNR